MTKCVTAGCLAFLLSAFYPTLAARAELGETVRFESAPLQPSEFQKQKAKETGKTAAGPPGDPLLGYLSKPDRPGPFPAVVILHGCDGIHDSVEGAWSRRFVSWGYVALVVDSLKTRGLKDISPL